MKGIILAGGTGSRLRPLTTAVSKQLLPVYDKPMIYYPLSVLMLAGIDEILVITTTEDQWAFKKLLGDGSDFGISLSFAVQENPDGLAQAFIIGEDFIGSDSVALILGDNIFWGQGFSEVLKRAVLNKEGATVFGYMVSNPEDFGVIGFDQNKNVTSIEEKPKNPASNFAATGLYVYDNAVVNIAKRVEPSERGEYEITSINKEYLKNKALHVELLGRGFAWLDTGTHASLHQANVFVETVQKRQGFMIACLEEIAIQKGWLSIHSIGKIAEKYGNSDYGRYLRRLI